MGKVFSNLNASKDTRHKRKLKCHHNKYLKPGALAQQHSHEILIATPYAKRRVAVLDDGMVDNVFQHNLIVQSPSMQSPMKASYPIAGFVSASDSNIHLKTSKTPVVNNAPSDSILESLPMDILVGTFY
uniref:Uncharacterized protein n=1 Tax=Kalanchoe fedtschenkoi TaxID=63787 RepID=A0A7N0T9N1_KALFE